MDLNELEEEAEEKYVERLKQSGHKVEYRNQTYNDGYLDGAEPREKRIEELEKENKVLAQNLEDTEIVNKALEKENAELERKLEQTEKDLADYQFNYPTIKELQKENAELKDMIKEMYFLLRNYDKFFLGDRLLKCFETVENYNFLKDSEGK